MALSNMKILTLLTEPSQQQMAKILKAGYYKSKSVKNLSISAACLTLEDALTKKRKDRQGQKSTDLARKVSTTGIGKFLTFKSLSK